MKREISPVFNFNTTQNASYREDIFAAGNPLIDSIVFLGKEACRQEILHANELYLKEKLGNVYDIICNSGDQLKGNEEFLAALISAIKLIPDLAFPLPRVLLLYKHISNAIRESYLKTSWKVGIVERNKVTKGLLLCGFNGIGKSRALSAALGLIKQVIIHRSYQGTVFSQIQVVWLRVHVGGTDTPKGLCSKFFQALDLALGLNEHYFRRYGNLNKHAMLNHMKTLVREYRIGLLAFDEIQRINQYSGIDRDSIVAFLMELVDEVNVQVVLCGTPPAETVLQRDPACAGRYDFWAWPTCHPEDWNKYINWLWQQQFGLEKQPLTVGLFDKITKLSAMIPRVACSLFVKAYEHSILTDKPMSPGLLETIYKKDFMQIHMFLEAVRSKNYEEISKYRNGADIIAILSETSLGSQPITRTAVKKYIHDEFTQCLENPGKYFDQGTT